MGRPLLALAPACAALAIACGTSGDVLTSGDAALFGPPVDGASGSGRGHTSSEVRLGGSGSSTRAGGGGSGATGGSDGGGGCAPSLTGRLRDFVNKPGFTPASALDDDFENAVGDDRGIVETDLGADQKPLYAHGTAGTATTHGKTQFDWWYRDTPGKNLPFAFTVPLTELDGGVETYDNQEFFPLDGRGWDDTYTADDGKQHNFSFTFELHTTFAYKAGDVFTFIGDDDVFVFIAKKLVVDLGGVHPAESKTISLDALVTDDAAGARVPLTVGATYPLDIFYNERHTVASHFRMETSIAFNNCTPIIVPR